MVARILYLLSEIIHILKYLVTFQFPLTTTATMESDETNNNNNKNQNKNNQVRPVTYAELMRMKNLGGIRTTSRNSGTLAGNGRSTSQPPERKTIRPTVRNTISDDVIHTRHLRKPRKPQTPVPINDEQPEKPAKKNIFFRKLHGETFQILVTLCMQDGPFLILRLFLLVR